MSKIKSAKNKEWEKDRRNRLNKAFETLAKLLPKYDPSAPFSKIEILQRSILYVEELQKKYKELLAGNDKILFNQNEELEESLELLRSRNNQLSDLLRKAGITIPAKNPYASLKKVNKNKENETILEDQPEVTKTEENNFNQINIKPTGRPKKYENVITSEQIAALTENVKQITDNLEKETTKKLAKKKSPKNVKNNKSKTKTQPVVKKVNSLVNKKSKLEEKLVENVKPDDKKDNEEGNVINEEIVKVTDIVEKKVVATSANIVSISSIIKIPPTENTCLLMANNKVLGTLQRASIVPPTDVTATYTSFTTPIMATGVFLPNGNIVPMSGLQSQPVTPCQTTSLLIVNNNNTTKTVESKVIIKKRVKNKLNKISIKSRTPSLIKSKMMPGKLPIPKLKKNVILLTRKTIRKINHNNSNNNKNSKKFVKEKIINEKINNKKRKIANVNKNLVKKSKNTNKKEIINDEKSIKCNEQLSTAKEVIIVNECDKLCVVEEEKSNDNVKTINKFQTENNNNSNDGEGDLDQANNYLNSNVNKIDINEVTHNTLSLTLPHSDLSNDLFESLQVPPNSSHQESLSPTAAFLLTFPLVSSGGKVTEVGINDENLTENHTSPPSLLQIGQIVDTPQHINETRNVNENVDKTVDTNNLNDNSNNLLLENLSSLFSNNNTGNSCKNVEKRISYDTTEEKTLNTFTNYDNNNNNNFNYLNTVKLSNNNNNKEIIEETTTITGTTTNNNIFTNNNNNNNFIEDKNYSLKSCSNNHDTVNDIPTKYTYSTINNNNISNNTSFIESNYKTINNHNQAANEIKDQINNNNFVRPEFTFTLTSFSSTATTVTSSTPSVTCLTSIEQNLPYKSVNNYSSILPNINTRTTATIAPTASTTIHNSENEHNNKYYYGKTSSFNDAANYYPHYVYNTPSTTLETQNGFSFSLINTTTASSMDTSNTLNLTPITTQSSGDKFNAKDFKTQFSFNFSSAPPYMPCTTLATSSSVTLTSTIATKTTSATVPPPLPMSMTDVTYSNLTPNYNSYTPFAFDANLSNFSAENFHSKVSSSTAQNDTMNFTFALTSTTKSQAKYTTSALATTTSSLASAYTHSAYNPFSIDATLNSIPTSKSDCIATKHGNIENKTNSSCLVDSMRVPHVPMHIPMPSDNNPMIKSSYDYCIGDFVTKSHSSGDNVGKKENHNSFSSITNTNSNNINNNINMNMRTPTKKHYSHNIEVTNKYDSRSMMNIVTPSSASIVQQKTPPKTKNSTTTTTATPMSQQSKYCHVGWMSSPEFKQMSQNDNYPMLPPLEFGQNTTHGSSFYSSSHVPTVAPPPQPTLRNIELNRKPSDIFFAHPPGDDNFSWSPNKITNTLEAPSILGGHSYLPTLPTLHGDLALNPMTCNTNNFMVSSYEDKKLLNKEKSTLSTTTTNNNNKTAQYHNSLSTTINNNAGSSSNNNNNNNNTRIEANSCNNAGSFFSVSQLVNQEQSGKNNYQHQQQQSIPLNTQQQQKTTKASNKNNNQTTNNKIKQKLKFDDIVNKRDNGSIKSNINDKRYASYPIITSPIINHHYNNETPNIFIDSYNNTYGSEQNCSTTLVLPPAQQHHQQQNQTNQQQQQLQQQQTNKTNIYSAESLIGNKKDKNNKFYNHHIDMYSGSTNSNNDTINTSDVLPTIYNPHHHHPAISSMDFNNMENNHFSANFRYNNPTPIITTTVVTTNTSTIITTTATTTGITTGKPSTVLPTNFTFQQNCLPLTDDYNTMCFPMDIINSNNDIKTNKTLSQNINQQQQQQNLYRSDDLNATSTSHINNNQTKSNNNTRMQSNLASRNTNNNKKPTISAVTTAVTSTQVTTTPSWKQHDIYSLPSTLHHHSHVLPPPSTQVLSLPSNPNVSSGQHHHHQQHSQQQHHSHLHNPSNYDTTNYFPVSLTKNPPIVTSVPPPLPATGISTSANSASLMDDPFYSLHSFNYSNNIKNYPPPPHPNHLSAQHHHNHYSHQYHHNHTSHNPQLPSSTLTTNSNPLTMLTSSAQPIISSLALPTHSSITTSTSATSNNNNNNTGGAPNNILQNSTNSLTNFNLSTICPEINDKVRQQNW